MAKEYVQNIELSDLLDVPALQELIDNHYSLTGMAVGIIDLEGKVLVGAGWQDICTKFHRVNPESCQFCRESDISLSSGVALGAFKAYRCKNNMWDVATPIMVGDRHIGNIFNGQFMYDDEEPDYDLFRAQARRFGYDEEKYIAALNKVPRFGRDFVKNSMSFYTNLAQMISKSNYSNILFKKREAELHQLNRTLKASNSSMQAIMRINDEAEYLNEVCRLITEDCGHAMVWIGYAEDDIEKNIRPVASAGFDIGYLETLKLSWMDTERGRGPTGRTIRSGKMCMCKNMLTDPAFSPWREEALRRGYASSVSFPLSRDGKTFGALTIYSRMPDPFMEAELELLAELTDRLAYGIATLRLRAEKEKSDVALKQTEIDLRSAVASRDEFFSIASHELRTPLTALHLNLEMLLRFSKKLAKGAESQLVLLSERAIGAEKHLGKLIDELLDITRIRAGRLEIKKQEMLLTAKVNEVVWRMSESAARTGSTITLFSPHIIKGNWDPTRIDQVITNILSNAIKYGNGRPIEVSVITDPDKLIAKVTVLDHGIGISAELQAKIFNRFERAVSNNNISGLGLGLYIVRELVEAHGGTISVTSTLGEGSMFVVELPIDA